jgi:hypothetical protein
MMISMFSVVLVHGTISDCSDMNGAHSLDTQEIAKQTLRVDCIAQIICRWADKPMTAGKFALVLGNKSQAQ